MRTEYDVVIIGAGAAGISAAYALKDSRKSVLLIEKLDKIGGTHLNAWINVHSATPAPPFLRSILLNEIRNGNATYLNDNYQNLKTTYSNETLYNLSFLRNVFTNESSSVEIGFNIESMRSIYEKDLRSIDIRCNAVLKGIECIEDGILSKITIEDREQGTIRIKSKIFIDCTANNALLLAIDPKKCLWGIDGKSEFQRDYGFIEDSNQNINHWPYINNPTLMYRIVNGKEKEITDKYRWSEIALLYKEPNSLYTYVNTVGGLYDMSKNPTMDGYNQAYTNLQKNVKEQWTVLKKSTLDMYKPFNLTDKRFSDFAPSLGIRESYRTRCVYMLHEGDLYKNVLKNKNESIIAVGNHLVDFHSNSAVSGINISNINSKLRPYGVPYGCIVPMNLKNVLVASRGAGFTHIAAASFRLNKDMMQIGWAAGWAAHLGLEEMESIDFNNIDYNKLRSLIKLDNTLDIVCEVYKNEK